MAAFSFPANFRFCPILPKPCRELPAIAALGAERLTQGCCELFHLSLSGIER